ncbi:MAG: ATP-dependent helicase [Nitrospirota bacterium]
MPYNPALQAAQEALRDIFDCIDEQNSFIVEAGAGSGKTYSLVEALKYLIKNKGKELLAQYQQVACISYTNVASNEISSRIYSHPAIHSSTIHSFCWLIIKNYQSVLRKELSISDEKWIKKLKDLNISDGIGTRTISYDEFGHRSIKETSVSLHHDDVLELTVRLIEKYPKFRKLLVDRYPVIFIDEYQDTDKGFVDVLKKCFIDSGDKYERKLLFGFFGDPWQKIYDDVCGAIEHKSLKIIFLRSNFRSSPVIINILNSMRQNPHQEAANPEAEGFVKVYHTNGWEVSNRRTGTHWKGDLPADVAHKYLDFIKKQLTSEGWDFAPEKTKILMLTHTVLANEQGYANIANVFEYKESFTKKNDPYIAFLVETVEPVSISYKNKRYGEMFQVLGGRPYIQSQDDKKNWHNHMDELLKLRDNGTIGEVIEHLKLKDYIRLPDAVQSREDELNKDDENSSIDRIRNLRMIQYKEIIALTNYINNNTPFSTQHSVKGEEYENVLVVIGRGWNFYDFNKFLEEATKDVPENQLFYERNRNLFYVVCSRPKKRLAVLFTQELSSIAMETIKCWFGPEAVCGLKL